MLLRLMEQERSAAQEKTIAELTKNGLPGSKQRRKGVGACCGGKPKKNRELKKQ